MRRRKLSGIVAIALLAPALLASSLLCGCSRLPILSEPPAKLIISTDPPNAIVYLRARTTARGNAPRGEYWAVGTTPFEGDLENGYWDLRVESPGYEPVEILVRAVPGTAQAYDLSLLDMRIASRR